MGRRLVVGVNDLPTVCPEVAAQWDYEKNGDLKPENVSYGSGKKVWWICPKDPRHSWAAKVANRTKGRGCPICDNKVAVPGINDLATTHPEIAAEWDYEKNGGKTPQDFTYGSKYKAWWICPDHGHSYSSVINHRTLRGDMCHYCSGRAVLEGFNDLATTHPEIAMEWDYEKNGDLKPTMVTHGCVTKVHWVCADCGNKWPATVASRTNENCHSGCPECAQRERTKKWVTPRPGESFADLHPDLAELWDYEKNGDLTPQMFRPASLHVAHWQCTECKHKWTANIRAISYGKSSCLECARKVIAKKKSTPEPGKSLADLKPEVLSEWDYELNDKDPSEVNLGARYLAWWICPNCPPHSNRYQASVNDHAKRGDGCPYCAGKRLEAGRNDFATKYPEVAAEWDYEKNGDLRPEMFTKSSPQKVWWICKKGHPSWQAIIANRAKGSGCPACKERMRVSFPEKAGYFFLPFDDKKANYSPDIEGIGKRDFDIYIPSIRTAIEYDGQRFHTDIQKDLYKDKLCAENGIRMIRIREPKCPRYDSPADFVYRSDTTSDESLENAIREMLRLLGQDDSGVDIAAHRDEIQQLKDMPTPYVTEQQ